MNKFQKSQSEKIRSCYESSDLEKGEHKSHKYIRKEGDKYVYEDTKTSGGIVGLKEIRQVLIQGGLNPDHIFRSYNDKISNGRRYKFTLSVHGGAITGEKAVNKTTAQKIGDTLSKIDAEDIYITENEISFKIRDKK